MSVSHEESDINIAGDLQLRRRAHRRHAGRLSGRLVHVRVVRSPGGGRRIRPNPLRRRARGCRLPPEPRLQVDPRQDLGDYRDDETGAARRLSVGRQERRDGPDSDRRSDEADGQSGAADASAGAARRSGPSSQHRGLSGHQASTFAIATLVSLVSLRVCRGDGARADDRRAGAGLSPRARAPASAIPAPLREIGFDQQLDQPLPLDTEFSGRRRGARFGSASISDRSRWCWGSSTTTARCCAARSSTR